MSVERKVSWLFRACAVINWTVSVRGIIDPVGYLSFFGGPAFRVRVHLPSLGGFRVHVRMHVLGDESRCPKQGRARQVQLDREDDHGARGDGRYLLGEVPTRLMMLIVLTNWIWIPFLFHYDMRLRSAMGPQSATYSMNRYGASYPEK